MGGRQSKPEDLAVHVNPNETPVPINFSPALLDSLSKPSPDSMYTPSQVETIVRTALSSQLETISEIESEVRKAEEEMMARELSERAEKMARESRTIRLRVPEAEVLRKERAVVECLRRNKDRPIDCWKEFEEFKEVARRAFQESVGVGA